MYSLPADQSDKATSQEIEKEVEKEMEKDENEIKILSEKKAKLQAHNARLKEKVKATKTLQT
jgi:hypothetical protein